MQLLEDGGPKYVLHVILLDRRDVEECAAYVLQTGPDLVLIGIGVLAVGQIEVAEAQSVF